MVPNLSSSHLNTESLLKTTKLCCHQIKLGISLTKKKKKKVKGGLRVKGLQVPSLQINSVLRSRLFQQEMNSSPQSHPMSGFPLESKPQSVKHTCSWGSCWRVQTCSPGETKPTYLALFSSGDLKPSLRHSRRYCSWHVS